MSHIEQLAKQKPCKPKTGINTLTTQAQLEIQVLPPCNAWLFTIEYCSLDIQVTGCARRWIISSGSKTMPKRPKVAKTAQIHDLVDPEWGGGTSPHDTWEVLAVFHLAHEQSDGFSEGPTFPRRAGLLYSLTQPPEYQYVAQSSSQCVRRWHNWLEQFNTFWCYLS